VMFLFSFSAARPSRTQSYVEAHEVFTRPAASLRFPALFSDFNFLFKIYIHGAILSFYMVGHFCMDMQARRAAFSAFTFSFTQCKL
jgi:hypothetical protein